MPAFRRFYPGMRPAAGVALINILKPRATEQMAGRFDNGNRSA